MNSLPRQRIISRGPLYGPRLKGVPHQSAPRRPGRGHLSRLVNRPATKGWIFSPAWPVSVGQPGQMPLTARDNRPSPH